MNFAVGFLLGLLLLSACTRGEEAKTPARHESPPQTATSSSSATESTPIDPTLRAMQKARDIKAGEDKKAAETNEALDP